MSNDRSEYLREWQNKNHDKRREYFKKRIICDVCGANISMGTKYFHVRTKKHLSYIK
jgi:hypothetical protein